MHPSIWSRDVSIPERPALRGEADADAVVIGAGLCGVLTAHFLSQAGLKTIIVEADRIGGGQSAKTTAKITCQHGLIYHRSIEQLGKEKSFGYAQANLHAVEQYRKLVRDENIDCAFTDAPACLYSALETRRLEEEFKAARSLGLRCEMREETELPFEVKAALYFPHQAHFHPLRFLQAISAPLRIYEHSRVLEAAEGEVRCSEGRVKARYIVFACHYPFVLVPGYYFLRMHQERSHVLAVRTGREMKGMYYGIDEGALSLRPAGDLLLLSGENHRTGENSRGGRFDSLRRKAREYFPGCTEEACWSAQDCMTLDGFPYIGRFSGQARNWYVATGFEKWGMTNSMVAALLLRDLITGQNAEWGDFCSPDRFLPPASMSKFGMEAAKSSKGLARSFLLPPRAELESLPQGHGGIVDAEGEKLGVYRDAKGELHAVLARCPHLGCQLEWNPDEKSWDCPCHGSRFGIDGELLEGPAQRDLSRND